LKIRRHVRTGAAGRRCDADLGLRPFVESDEIGVQHLDGKAGDGRLRQLIVEGSLLLL
jgi:hypothetical protein